MGPSTSSSGMHTWPRRGIGCYDICIIAHCAFAFKALVLALVVTPSSTTKIGLYVRLHWLAMPFPESPAVPLRTACPNRFHKGLACFFFLCLGYSCHSLPSSSRAANMRNHDGSLL
mmetsp:Transcript_27739/g.77722  ORF Transcript_27739/g.77722 Transcript_27739/m.77722 type:complete len:116 (+) Transcript_27739:29-376(+)